MGNPGDGAKRAWQLDFRCAAIRRKTGGRGIVLLSATPAKNSPLEFYNLIQYVDPRAWTRLGITDPEQFIDRYLKIEIKPVVNAKLEVEDRGAVTGFQNLNELRDVIFRYGDFKTAEEVGLKLPEPKVEMVEVDMDDAQEDKYDRYVARIEAALSSGDPSDKQAILGLLARLALVAIHPQLDEGFDWRSAGRVSNPSSPKFEALAERVLTNRTCGHIVFVENVPAHAWVRDVLVKHGIPVERIAILNAEVAEASADRQRIAQEFNGNAEEGLAPKYDIVIANAIAYEGIDLQTRTCAIHHLDLPWEPATLQQRNGRGVRQGNTLGAIAIYYYFARRSQDGLRFNLIQGKRGWMTQLLHSQDRDTNNPGAQMEIGPEETLLLISRDPEKTRSRLQAVKIRREAEAKAKIATEASRLLRSINARFRQAERSKDATESARLRGEAEARLKDLARMSPDAWPWMAKAEVVRDRPVLVPEGGGPVYEGLRVGVPGPFNAAQIDYAEFGRPTREGGIGLRGAGSALWQEVDSKNVRLSALEPRHYEVGWPDYDDPRALGDLAQRAEQVLRNEGNWAALGWHMAPDTWVERLWGQGGRIVLDNLAKVPPYLRGTIRVPALGLDGLRLLEPQQAVSAQGQVLPPTELGWRSFLSAAPAADLTFTQLQEVGRYWWNRTIPRDLLVGSEGANRQAMKEAA